jgi:hypothetical protein
MNRTGYSLCLIVVVTLFANVLAQDSVDLSGTWVMDAQASASLARSPSATSQVPLRLVVEQSATGVLIRREGRDGQSRTTTYSFAEPPSAATIASEGPGRKPSEAIGTTGSVAAQADRIAPASTVTEDAKAEWKDGHLQLLTVMSVNGKEVTVSETLKPSANGQQLVIETHLAVQHGYETGAASGNGTDVYLKVKP